VVCGIFSEKHLTEAPPPPPSVGGGGIEGGGILGFFRVLCSVTYPSCTNISNGPYSQRKMTRLFWAQMALVALVDI
jgi:hypothetical protein